MNMDSNKIRIIGVVVILLLCSQSTLYGYNEGDSTAEVGDPDSRHAMGISVPAEEEQSESDILEYFAKKKSEILNGRKFNDHTTPANALLTLISAYHHQDQKTLEQIIPIVRQKQFERLSSPEVGAQILTYVRKASLCRIEIENQPPKESDLCAIYSSQSPDKTIDQVWSFAYVKGAWRFAGSTSEMDNWRTQAKQVEAMTRTILQSEAEKTKAAATNTLRQKANNVEGKWYVILSELNQKFVIRFWRKPDGALAGAATLNSPDDRPFDGITFENGRLRFEEKVNQAVFEGTMKEDGLTIEGKFEKPGLMTPCVLERAYDVEVKSDSGVVQPSQKRLQSRNRLIAWWKLDETDGKGVADSSGNAFGGKLVGNPQWRTAGGKIGGALELDGDGDYVQIENESAFDIAGPITVAAWIKVNSFDKRWQAVVTKGDTAWRLQRFAEDNTLAFHCTGITSVTGERPEGIEGRKNVNDGQWHHVVGVYDGSAILLYIDGVLDNSSKASGEISMNDSAVIIGGNSEQIDRKWNGFVDEVCVFACALDASNVSALYAVESPLKVAEQAPASDESVINRLLSLDGEGDYVQVADSESLRSFSNAITIEVWFKASSFYPENGMVNSIIRKNITANSENFFIRFRNVAGGQSVEMSVGYDNEVLKAPYNFAVDTWYHLAGTYDGKAIKMFVNGLDVKSEIASGALYIDESDVLIGKGDPEFSSGEFFHGALDELRIWNVARSPEEIRAAMNSPLTGKENGLLVYLNFDDGTAKDLSGHGNDGLLNADAQVVESPFPASPASEGEQPGRLLAWWKFENDANDSAGNNNGTINGNPTYADGKVGRAISLDGDDYVDFGNPGSLNFGAGDWTISAWFKTTQTGSGQEDALMNRGTVFANGGDEAGGIRYALAVNEGQLGSITLTTDNDASKIQAVSRAAVNDGVWHHIVGVRKAEQLYIYVDGVLDGGNYLYAGYDLSGTSQRNAYLGAIMDNRDGSLYKYFVGLVDEVCIFAGAIDDNGIRALYSGKDPVTVAKTAVQARSRPASETGAADSETSPASQEQLQIRTSSTGNIATALILILALAGVVGAIVYFLVKSSIR